jgi:hypothetical protein
MLNVIVLTVIVLNVIVLNEAYFYKAQGFTLPGQKVDYTFFLFLVAASKILILEPMLMQSRQKKVWHICPFKFGKKIKIKVRDNK